MIRPFAFLVTLMAATQLHALDPASIKWETNDKEPVFSADAAKGGGTFNSFMTTYPQTFRLWGPNSNDAFANWNRRSCLDFGTVMLHPDTRQFLPMLATHWSIQADNRTVYFKLDPDARWNDGKPVTADDYVFGYEMMMRPEIADPFYNKHFKERFETVEKVDELTIKVVGRNPSWRPLWDYSVTPIPKHATKLTKDWVKASNWEKPVCVGPYIINTIKLNQEITFKRLRPWWGDSKKYLKNRYNFDRIVLKVIKDDRIAFEHFKKKELTLYSVSSAAMWATETDFPEVKKNWIAKRRIYTESPQGLFGLIMNLQKPIFKDKNFRKALQHLFDFKTLNEKLMYNSYGRLVSAFSGTEYANSKLRAPEFDRTKAREFLKAAGFEKRGPDGVRLRADGTRASFTLIFGSQSTEKHLSVIAETLKSEGIEAKLKPLDGATSFRYLLQRNYEMAMVSMNAGLYPEPWQYFHSSFVGEVNNNNFFAFGSPKTDALIETYRNDINREKRLAAMAELDAIIQDEAFYIPFWSGSFVRFLAWNEMGWPSTIENRLSSSVNESETFFFDPDRAEVLAKARAAGTAIPITEPVDHDPFGVLKKSR